MNWFERIDWFALIVGAIAVLWGLNAVRRGARELNAWGLKGIANNPAAGCVVRFIGAGLVLMGVLFVVQALGA